MSPEHTDYSNLAVTHWGYAEFTLLLLSFATSLLYATQLLYLKLYWVMYANYCTI